MGEKNSKEAVTIEKLLSEDQPEKLLSSIQFEEGLKLVEELVQRVEGGEYPLEKTLLSYERGMKLITHLRTVLSGAEERVHLVQKEAVEAQSDLIK